MQLNDLPVELAVQLHELIKPRFGARGSADIVGEANSGDYTFAIDHDAEEALGDLVDQLGTKAGVRLSYYSEDRGLVKVHDDPQYVFVVDPIDGTRPAVCGLESTCVSVAMAPLNGPAALLKDVVAACLVEIKSGDVISAAAGGQVQVRRGGSEAQAIGGNRLSRKVDITKMFWAHEICGRPSEATNAVLGDLINTSSFAAATFVFNSASYAISRVVLGQLDAYVDVYAALLNSPTGSRWEDLSRSKFHGKVFGLFPYDIAAAAFIAMQAGAFISDGHGQPLDKLNLLNSSRTGISSAVVAGNSNLGHQILSYLGRGYERAEATLIRA
jgi:myo-inositol-1(or 4)-monophosphatase